MPSIRSLALKADVLEKLRFRLVENADLWAVKKAKLWRFENGDLFPAKRGDLLAGRMEYREKGRDGLLQDESLASLAARPAEFADLPTRAMNSRER